MDRSFRFEKLKEQIFKLREVAINCLLNSKFKFKPLFPLIFKYFSKDYAYLQAKVLSKFFTIHTSCFKTISNKATLIYKLKSLTKSLTIRTLLFKQFKQTKVS